jgi:hypothetical protein
MPRRRALLAAILLAMPAVAGAASRVWVAGTREAPLRLRLDAPRAIVEREGARTALALPVGGAVDAFVATRRGWLAAGSVPVKGGRELALWRDAAAGAQALAPPPGKRGALRSDPLPLVHDGRLVGLAWLEGEAADRLGVWTASWDGGAWSTPVEVSPPGAGSQLALTGDVLADGSWLLAWSALEGKADEILWSRRQGTRWSPPQRVDRPNAVPDVTPALRRDGSGALLAWSRYDGNDYRLLLARFTGGRWQAPRRVGGPGTVLPSWEQGALLFRDAAHAAWVGAKVASGGDLDLVVAQPGAPEPRPALVAEGARLRFEMP